MQPDTGNSQMKSKITNANLDQTTVEPTFGIFKATTIQEGKE